MLRPISPHAKAHYRRNSSDSSTYSQRRLITWLSIVGNLLLIIAAYQEWTKISTCKGLIEEQQHPKQVLEGTNVLPTPPQQTGNRRLLVDSMTTQQTFGYQAALQQQQPTTSTTRRLLAEDTTPRTLGTISSPPPPSDALHIADDLSDNPSFDPASHEFTWNYCPLTSPAATLASGASTLAKTRPYCPTTPNNEQKWQMSWFSPHVVPGPAHPFPTFLDCTHLPPTDYKWPTKLDQVQLPTTSDAVHWPNLRVSKREELVVFNQATPKNLYHFDSAKYDLDALSELEYAEKYIPFKNKIRLAADIGAGGGSLGLLLKKKYDVQTLSTVFADWPYCEYITLRGGGSCILLDVMQALPVAKFTFDVLHVSWVYHGQAPDELKVMFHELNRILRPGGYLWLRGGWAREQFDFLSSFLKSLGYSTLHEDIQQKPPQITEKVFFGPDKTLPYAVDWTAILVKPIAKQLDCSGAQTSH